MQSLGCGVNTAFLFLFDLMEDRVVEQIPNGSAVVFMFGEIDCREGILLAVNKMRYDTVKSGVEHTVGIFIKVRAI